MEKFYVLIENEKHRNKQQRIVEKNLLSIWKELF